MPSVVKIDNGPPFRVTISDGSYIDWDKKDGLFRVAYYKRSTAKEFGLRNAIALATKKPLYAPLVDILMKFIEEREEYANAISSKEMVQ